MHVFWVPVQGEANDRYEPLPGFFELPAWFWRKLPRGGKVAVACLGAGLVVLAIVLSPVIQRSKERARRRTPRSARGSRARRSPRFTASRRRGSRAARRPARI